MSGKTSALNGREAKERFQRLYEENCGLMLCVANGILHNQEDAEDAVHSAFLSIADCFDKIEIMNGRKVKGLCVLIVKHKAIDIIRMRKRISYEAVEDMDLHSDNPEESPEACLELKEQKEYVKNMLGRLPEISKKILIMKYYYGLDNSEISRLLNMNKKAVEMRIFRAYNKIREMIDRGDE
ncbi:MAG: sigma-70 family RNA polymerase sigma factor [Lachnospiraceae bacterium]|nr:sigma-70 family RNA polymerase sigma factor [Lachnospiraceae bacterium]